ncbi:hypothetical protein CAEBREN_10520 [Caenorhabditis brenneri]|uniref:Uncharacterized protein n=1 Tax=Caenorhabditis brenneri TaxID=135651 RepID=G0NJ50_CAEBE|nr:hypothetical protein CAEBREN_10520 [Caenorhabditis brenneri]
MKVGSSRFFNFSQIHLFLIYFFLFFLCFFNKV